MWPTFHQTHDQKLLNSSSFYLKNTRDPTFLQTLTVHAYTEICGKLSCHGDHALCWSLFLSSLFVMKTSTNLVTLRTRLIQIGIYIYVCVCVCVSMLLVFTGSQAFSFCPKTLYQYLVTYPLIASKSFAMLAKLLMRQITKDNI